MRPKVCSFLALLCVWRVSAQTYSVLLTRDQGSNEITLKCRNFPLFQTLTTAKFWRKDDSNAQLIYLGQEYRFTLTPNQEGYYCCGEDSISTAGCSTAPLLAYPVVDPDTQDFYSIAVGTPFTSLDCGITPGALSTFYTLEWHKALTLLVSTSSSERIEVVRDNFSLTVQNATLSDGGEYTCFVDVQSNSATQCVTVLVYEIQVNPNDRQTLVVEPGEQRSMSFTCSFAVQTSSEALESLSLGWSHNSVRLTSNGEKYNITIFNEQSTSYGKVVHNTRSILTVNDLELMDSGDYECGVDVSVITPEAIKEERTLVTSTTLLVITDEMELQVTKFLGGHIELCLANLPPVVPELKAARFKIRLTEVKANGGDPSFIDWITTQALSVASDRLCYQYFYEDVLELGVHYESSKIQVSLSFDEEVGPLVPRLDMAEEIAFDITTAPTTVAATSSPNDEIIAITVGCAAVTIAVVVLLMVITTLCCRTYIQRRYSKTIAEAREYLIRAESTDDPKLKRDYIVLAGKCLTRLRVHDFRAEGADRDSRHTGTGQVTVDVCDKRYSLVAPSTGTTV